MGLFDLGVNKVHQSRVLSDGHCTESFIDIFFQLKLMTDFIDSRPRTFKF